MAKINLSDAVEVLHAINDLKIKRSGWANEIREGWRCSIPGAKEVIYEMYTISGLVILGLEQYAAGVSWHKMALHITLKKLQDLVDSDDFKCFVEMTDMGFTRVVSTADRQMIRKMFDYLKIMTE